MPTRIQRKRTAGWRMPEGAVSVTRPGIFGNPYTVIKAGTGGLKRVSLLIRGDHAPTVADAVAMFREYALERLQSEPDWLAPLRGKDLACWCPLPDPGQPDHCHAAVLLELANP